LLTLFAKEIHMNSFGYFELHTPDLARAKAFYGEMFGWKFDEVPGMPYSMIDFGKGEQGGAQPDKELPPQWVNYHTVENLDESTARAQKLGAKLNVPRTEVKGHGFFTVITDPTGVRIALWEELKK
jgi:predicted enzyme related to lactoylglutathione lyase